MNYENEIKIIKKQIVTLQEKINDIVCDLREQQLYEEVEKPFKVGDRVQFKTWEEMEKEFGVDEYGNIQCGFTDIMKYLCGTYATISSINGTRVHLKYFSINNYLNDILNYSFDMLKHAENEPKWVFTEEEKVILRNISNDYKYITRNNHGDLELYADEPYKSNDIWFVDGDSEFFDIYNDIFKCIQWTDEEPCEFRKYI